MGRLNDDGRVAAAADRRRAGRLDRHSAARILTPAVLGPALITGPVYCAGLYLGSRLFSRASETMFRRICYGLIAAAIVLSLPVLDGVLHPG